MDALAVTPRFAWYDPRGWPDWLRWLALLPGPFLVGAAVYLISGIFNSLFNTFGASDWLWVVAAFPAGLIVVLSARFIAPSFERLVGLVAAGALVLGCVSAIALLFTTPYHGQWPEWQLILVAIVAVVGAIAGTLEADKRQESVQKPEFFRWIPTPLRWLLFLPLGVLIGVAAAFAMLLLPVRSELTEASIALVLTSILIGVASAVVPKGKAIVGITLAIFSGLAGLGVLVGAVFRPLITAYFTRHYPNLEPGFYDPVWLAAAKGLAWLFAAIVGALGAVQADRIQKSRAQNATKVR